MPLEKNMRAAAERHYQDGVYLEQGQKFDNAGYHFGIAAECALKRKLVDVGVREDDEAIWKHYPALQQVAAIAIATRRAGKLRLIVERADFMRGWSIALRYSKNGYVDSKMLARWKSEAYEAIGLLYD